VNVDSAFVFFLEKLFGNETIRTFRETHLYDYLELEREFEIVKRKVKIDDNSKIAIRIPVSFLNHHIYIRKCCLYALLHVFRFGKTTYHDYVFDLISLLAF
jgi:hypothetical protein